VVTDVSEVCTASRIRAMSLHGATTQTTAIFNVHSVHSHVTPRPFNADILQAAALTRTADSNSGDPLCSTYLW
jgi:hypothetical protein